MNIIFLLLSGKCENRMPCVDFPQNWETKDKKDKIRQRPKRASNIAMSGQFCTLAKFYRGLLFVKGFDQKVGALSGGQRINSLVRTPLP